MADGGASLQDAARSLAECCICLDYLREPRALICHHVMCTTCLHDLLQKSPGNQVTCPECRGITPVSSGDVTDLPYIFYLSSLADAAKLSDEKTIECSACSHDPEKAGKVPPAAFRCLECYLDGDWLCDDCARHHRRLALTRSHQLLPVGDARKEGAPQPRRREATCEKHSSLELKFYCLNCNKAICSDCKVVDDNNHKAVLLVDHVRGQDGKLQSLLRPLHERVTSCESTLGELREEKTRAAADIRKYAQTWEQSRDKLLALIQKRDAEMKRLCEEKKRETEEQFDTLKKSLEQRLGRARDERDLEQARYTHGNNVERFELLNKLRTKRVVKDEVPHLDPVNFALPADATWIDLLMVPPQHADLLPGSQATLVEGNWARRTRGSLRDINWNPDPIALKLDETNRENYYIVDRAFAELLRWQPYPSSMDLKACGFPAGVKFYSKQRFPVALPVQFAYDEQSSSEPQHGGKVYALLAGLDQPLLEALKASGVTKEIRRVRDRNGTELDPKHTICQLMNMGKNPLKEFSELVVTTA